jgi:hypothetical protein
MKEALPAVPAAVNSDITKINTTDGRTANVDGGVGWSWSFPRCDYYFTSASKVTIVF